MTASGLRKPDDRGAVRLPIRLCAVQTVVDLVVGALDGRDWVCPRASPVLASYRRRRTVRRVARFAGDGPGAMPGPGAPRPGPGAIPGPGTPKPGVARLTARFAGEGPGPGPTLLMAAIADLLAVSRSITRSLECGDASSELTKPGAFGLESAAGWELAPTSTFPLLLEYPNLQQWHQCRVL